VTRAGPTFALADGSPGTTSQRGNRESRGAGNIYLMRVEQLYPFPARALIQELGRFPNAEISILAKPWVADLTIHTYRPLAGL